MKKRKLLCSLMSILMIFPVSFGIFSSNYNFFALQENLNITDDYLKYLCADEKAFKELCNEAGIVVSEKFSVKEALNLVEATQKKFLNRKEKQERWEASSQEWIEKKSEKICDILKKLGFVETINPQKTSYDAICILGSTGPAMKNRLNFTQKMVSQGIETNTIVLLTGERYLTKNIDGTDEELTEVAKFFNIEKEKLTEAHLFKYLYENSELTGKYRCVLIDTPQKNGYRPTTQTTTEDFLEWRKNNPEIKDVLIVSSQPSVKYQNAIIAEIIHGNKSDLTFETVGESCNPEKLQSILREIGAYIWAVMPHIFRTVDAHIDEKSLEKINKLYSHQKLIYNGFFE